MNEPEWVARGTVLELHHDSINEHGGTQGIREMDAAARTLALAAGEMTEASYAAWLDACSQAAP